MAATFETVDYSLRPNKNIERKLIAEALQVLQPTFDLAEYRYVGLGGILFVDFILFHKTLRIRDMISIQKGKAEAARALSNRPLACIDVREGESTTVLNKLPLQDKPILMWLDYDSALSGPILEDIPIICESLKSGDIVLFTLNGDHRQLVNQRAKGGIVRGRKEVLGDLLDIPLARIPDEAIEVDGFPKFVAEALFDRLRSVTRTSSGGELRFVPMFNYRYADGGTMITLGGMLADKTTERRMAATGIFYRDAETGERHHPFVTQLDQYHISVPLLTTREKIALDRLMPSDERIPEETLIAAGCVLDLDQVEAYRHLYRYYPVFAETG